MSDIETARALALMTFPNSPRAIFNHTPEVALEAVNAVISAIRANKIPGLCLSDERDGHIAQVIGRMAVIEHERHTLRQMLAQILARWDEPHPSFLEWHDRMAVDMTEARALLAQRNK